MEDPVFIADGHTYERRAIECWLDKKMASPKTGGDIHLMSDDDSLYER